MKSQIILLLALATLATTHAAEPPLAPRWLTKEEQAELALLNKQMARQVAARDFEEAARSAQQIADYRAERQGATYWETLDAQLNAEYWQRLTNVPARRRGNVASAYRATSLRKLVLRREEYGQAMMLLEVTLATNQKALGDEHFLTAMSHQQLGDCLMALGKYAEALPHLRQGLTASQKVLGERTSPFGKGQFNHPLTLQLRNSLARCLQGLGKYNDALPIFRENLEQRCAALGVYHPETADSYNNLADCLERLGRRSEALPLLRKALQIRLEILGRLHADTANSYSNLASCLLQQGKPAEALPLFEKATAIHDELVGERHTSTAIALANTAFCLDDLGEEKKALQLHQRALEIKRGVLGDHHVSTAEGYASLAGCLFRQGEYLDSLYYYGKAQRVYSVVLGKEHPYVALCYSNMADCLSGMRKHDEAMGLYLEALVINQNELGEHHPATAHVYGSMAGCLYRQGRFEEAVLQWEKALLGQEFARLKSSLTGFDRAIFHAKENSAHAALAATLVQLKQPVEAWKHAECDFARGLLDDSDSGTHSENDELAAKLESINLELPPLLEKTAGKLTGKQLELIKTRNQVLTDLARRAVKRSLDRVLPLERIQKQLPGDTALVFWLDVAGKHMGCVVRRQGPPVWVVLPGTGKRGRWREEDSTLPARTLAALADKTIATATRLNLVDELKGQRIAPLLPHLEKMKHLLVVPAGVMSAVPLEALTDNFTISYVPSASFFARGMEKHRPLEHAPLLVLADPDFQRPDSGQPAAPARGLLIKLVLPESLAARAGLRPGDVLLEYDSRPFARATDLESVADSKEQVSLKFWRDGIVLRSRIGSGKLGVIVDERPVNEALAKWRKQSGELSLLRGDKAWPPLPGTRLEARSLTALVNKSTLLQGSQANEERLAKLAAADELKQFRLLHLATHGEANALQPAETALILAQNQVPAKPKSGRLTVRTVLKDWELDADLVVLSACQSGLGKATAGDGMLGFTQALLQKGARSVVLSRWKVDDTATALLMVRFYENLLGRREGLKQPLERAEALAEAKTWLRTLTRDQAEHHLASLVQGVPRGERGTIKAALPTRQPEETKPQQDRPFAHPYYWAAFILLGDPR